MNLLLELHYLMVVYLLSSHQKQSKEFITGRCAQNVLLRPWPCFYLLCFGS
jgi:hypothetical protein